MKKPFNWAVSAVALAALLIASVALARSGDSASGGVSRSAPASTVVDGVTCPQGGHAVQLNPNTHVVVAGRKVAVTSVRGFDTDGNSRQTAVVIDLGPYRPHTGQIAIAQIDWYGRDWSQTTGSRAWEAALPVYGKSQVWTNEVVPDYYPTGVISAVDLCVTPAPRKTTSIRGASGPTERIGAAPAWGGAAAV